MTNQTALMLVISIALYGCGRKGAAGKPARTEAPGPPDEAIQISLTPENRAQTPAETDPKDNRGVTQPDKHEAAPRQEPDRFSPLNSDKKPIEISVKPTRETPTKGSLQIIRLIQDENAPRLHVVDERTGRSGMMSIGETFQGYHLKSINEKENTVEMEINGGEQSITATVPEPTNDRRVEVIPFPGIDDTSFPDRERIQPTQSERERGIDPNDSKTWPADYRGPTIERLQGGLGDQAPLDAQRTGSDPNFEQTEEERIRGIDPNNPNTWPDDYRGPGIERAKSD